MQGDSVAGRPAHLFYFDSGIGGLSAVREARNAGIRSKITYVADSRRMPYGMKTDEQLDRLGRKGMEHAVNLGVDVVVPACHTWETRAKGYRRLLGGDVAYVPLIESGANGVAGEQDVGKVATLSTNATADSGAYRDAIRRSAPHIDVTQVKGQNLAALVELHASGAMPNRRPIERELDEIVKAVPHDTDLVVQACTHYSFAEKDLKDRLPPRMVVVSSERYQARRLRELLGERAGAGNGETKYYTTGDVDAFRRQVASLLGDADADVERIRDFGDRASSDEDEPRRRGDDASSDLTISADLASSAISADDASSLDGEVASRRRARGAGVSVDSGNDRKRRRAAD